MADWTLWQNELATPTPEARRLDRPTDPVKMTGFWRNIGPRTGYDEPIAIWTKEGATASMFRRGVKENPPRPAMNTSQHAVQFQKFLTVGWLKCVAVSKADYDTAVETGFWPDGKIAKPMSTGQKLGIDIPAGDNAPPKDQSLADQIETLAAKIDALPEPETQEAANALSGELDRMKRLLDLVEAERAAEKEPFLTGGRLVDEKWKAIGQPGGDAYRKGTAAKKAFLKKEQEKREADARAETLRRRKEAEEAAAAERQRIAEETKARLEAEAAEAKRIADTIGEQAPPPLTDEEIAQRADEAAAEAVPAPVVEEVKAERVTAGSTFGRATGLKTVKKGVITDMAEFLLSQKEHAEIVDLAQKLANRFAKAGIAPAGMKIEEVLE